MVPGEATCLAEVIPVLLLGIALVSRIQDVMAGMLLLEIFSQAGCKQVRTNSWFFYLLRFGVFYLLGEGEHSNNFGSFLDYTTRVKNETKVNASDWCCLFARMLPGSSKESREQPIAGRGGRGGGLFNYITSFFWVKLCYLTQDLKQTFWKHTMLHFCVLSYG